MKANIIEVAGTEKYPYACIIEIDNIWVTDRICDEKKAQRIVQYTETCQDLNALKMKLAMACIELRMIRGKSKNGY